MSLTDAHIAQSSPVTDQALPVGTSLSGGKFTITDHLGIGGFGITYRAIDNTLGRAIVVKECFPEDFCFRDGLQVFPRNQGLAETFRATVKMFMREARSLAQLRHPNIVAVHSVFEENDTAYMVLDLIEGRDLYDILDAQTAPLPPARVKEILLQLLDAIEKVHEMDLLHRDISPDNILIEANGTPVLIDFGAARGEASRRTRAVSSLLVVKEGYSPQEFYIAGAEQSPSSDLYALGATFYHVLSGEAPPNSQSRLVDVAGKKPDPSPPLLGRIEGYDDGFLRAIDMAMEIHPADRLQSAAKWRAMILEGEAEDASRPRSGSRPQSGAISLELEMSLTQLVQETNTEVRRTSKVPEAPKTPPPPEPDKVEKPAWLDEFNKESLAPKAPSQPANDAGSARPRTTFVGGAAAPDADKTEVNWVGRAQEKQDRLRAEQAASYGLDEVPSAPKAKTKVVSTPIQPPADHDAEAEEPDPLLALRAHARTSTRKWFLAVLLGLFLLAVMVVLSQHI